MLCRPSLQIKTCVPLHQQYSTKCRRPDAVDQTPATCRQRNAVDQTPSTKCRRPNAGHIASTKSRRLNAVDQMSSTKCRRPRVDQQSLTNGGWSTTFGRRHLIDNMWVDLMFESKKYHSWCGCTHVVHAHPHSHLISNPHTHARC